MTRANSPKARAGRLSLVVSALFFLLCANGAAGAALWACETGTTTTGFQRPAACCCCPQGQRGGEKGQCLSAGCRDGASPGVAASSPNAGTRVFDDTPTFTRPGPTVVPTARSRHAGLEDRSIYLTNLNLLR